MADDNKIIVDLLVEGVDKFKADLKGGQDAVEKFTTEAKQGTTQAKQGFDQLGKSTESFKSQLKTMTSELIAANIQLAEMQDAGQQGTKEFTALQKKIEDLIKKAGNLKDAIGDANQVISQAGSDTAGLDKAIRAVGTATAAFQVFEGAAVLAGKGNEDLQKALVKLNAVMSVTQGLQQIQKELARDDSVLKGMAAKATAAYNLVVGQSTGALKAFRIALAATGIGLAIIGIAALVQNWSKLTDAIGLTNSELNNNAEIAKKQVEISERTLDAFDLEAKKLQLVGVEEENIIKLRQEKIKQVLNDQKISLEAEQAKLKIAEKNFEKFKKWEKAGFRFTGSLIFGDLGDLKEQQKVVQETTDKLLAIEEKYVDTELQLKSIQEKKAKEASDAAKEAEKNKQGEYEKSIDVLARYQEQLEKLKKEIIFLANEEIKAGRNPILNQKILTLQDEYIKLEKQIKSVQDVTDKLLNRPTQAEAIQLKIKIGDEKSIDDFNKSVAQQLEQMKPIVLQPETREQELKKVFDKAQQYYTQIQQVVGQTLDIVSNATQIRAENEIRALEKKRDRGLITEKQYEREVAKIKNESARKTKIAQTIMAFAMIPEAVLRAFTSALIPGDPTSIVRAGIFAGIAGAFATAQAALIAAAPLPKFKQGGSVAKKLGLMRGKSHEHGGIPIEVEGNEYVMNQKAVRKYGVDFMDSINNLKLSPAVTMQAKLDNLNKTDYKLYEHLSTLGSYMKQDYRINENGNRILMGIHEAIKRNNTYV